MLERVERNSDRKRQIERHRIPDVTWRIVVFRNCDRNRKENSSTRQCRCSYSRRYEKVGSRFRGRIITMASIDTNPMENVWEVLASKVYDRQEPPVENIIKL